MSHWGGIGIHMNSHPLSVAQTFGMRRARLTGPYRRLEPEGDHAFADSEDGASTRHTADAATWKADSECLLCPHVRTTAEFSMSSSDRSLPAVSF
jgi:hypothetical protein